MVRVNFLQNKMSAPVTDFKESFNGNSPETVKSRKEFIKNHPDANLVCFYFLLSCVISFDLLNQHSYKIINRVFSNASQNVYCYQINARLTLR